MTSKERLEKRKWVFNFLKSAGYKVVYDPKIKDKTYFYVMVENEWVERGYFWNESLDIIFTNKEEDTKND